MARYCSACGRPLTPEEHDGPESGLALIRRGRGRMPFQKVKRWTCRVRLVATAPSGKVFVPTSTDRVAEVNTRFVHESRFEGDLAP